jgi:prepilin-type N-terminal cleavage/methylation domain-containing protein
VDAVKHKLKHKRRNSGLSLPELLVTMVILAMSMIVLSQLVVLVTTGSITTTNKVFGMSASRLAINRIASDVRNARYVGDAYGIPGDRLIFPAPGNPIYNGSRIPIGGWPIPPWNQVMMVSDSVLVLQTPVVYQDTSPNNPSIINGLPVLLPAGYFGAADPPVNMENLNTIVYQVVPDTERTGEFALQVAIFPGVAVTGMPAPPLAINPPKTILRGIIGPKLTNGRALPAIFTYLSRAYSPTSQPSATMSDSITGVGIDIEVKTTGRSVQDGDGLYPQFIGLHDEAYMRSNRNMTFNNYNGVP